MYSYQYGGKDGQRFELIEADDLLVVRTAAAAPQLHELELNASTRNMVANLVPVAAFPEAQVTVYRIAEPDPANARDVRNLLREELRTTAGVRFAGRVLQDRASGRLCVYTENLFVQFQPDTAPQVIEQLLRQEGLFIKEELGFAPNAFFVGAQEGTGLAIFAIAERLLQQPAVALCHPEMVQEKKNRNIHPMQWHLKTTTINGQTVNAHIDVETAWLTTRGAGTTICIIDDGIAYDHLEFSQPGKVVFPRDTVQNVDDARPKFVNENHGTACAGVACAAGRDKAAGVAPEARLLPIRSGGLGSMAESKAFAWAADKGADVISCSWGPVDGAWWNPSDPLHRTNFPLPDSSRLALEYALTKGRGGKGCVICWAAGNGNEDVQFDGYASYPKVVAVAACNDRGKRSIYSDFGQAIWCAFPSNDFFVPELNQPRPLTPGIWTTDRPGDQGYNRGGYDAENTVGDRQGNYTATFGGTSSACPGVAGVVALILAVNPNLTWVQVKNILRASCDPIDQLGGSYDATGKSRFYGYGRVNAAKAVQNAQAILPAADLFEVVGKASFSQNSEVTVKEGVLTGDAYPTNRLMGFQLRLQPSHPDLKLQYRVFIANQGASPFAQEGSYAGTRDRRRRLVGFQIQLIGPLAKTYAVVYQAKVSGSRELLSARDGSVCGSASMGGATILEMKVSVVRR